MQKYPVICRRDKVAGKRCAELQKGVGMSLLHI